MLGKTDTFEQFLITESAQIPLIDFSINLMIAALMSYILGLIYVKYGNSLSNRNTFSKNLILISVTTMVIISIVKSSLALSLGLVGALSIVRFRAAIKEPEELAYLFMAITIGLGLGADQAYTIITSFILIALFIIVRNYSSRSERQVAPANLYLTIRSNLIDRISIDPIVEIFRKHGISAKLKRFDESKDVVEYVFNISIDNVKDLVVLKSEFRKIDNDMELSVLDQEGVIL
jgi:hypothetical protein